MLEIRPAALAEFSLLPAIEVEADGLLTEINGRPLAAALPSAATVQDFAAALHVLVAGRPPVGFARLVEVAGAPHLEQLSVLPAFARQGTGRALVNAAVSWAREAGYRQLTLCTFAEVPFNAPFYASCGFAPDPCPGPELLQVRTREKSLGLDDLGTRVVMRKNLRE